MLIYNLKLPEIRKFLHKLQLCEVGMGQVILLSLYRIPGV